MSHLLIREESRRDKKIPTMTLAIIVANEMSVRESPLRRLRLISMPMNNAHIKNTENENSA